MVEPEEIVVATATVFDMSLAGLHILVTAGGTREAIDPVRYLGNRSSGKMGHAVAIEALRRGARVVLITSSDLQVPESIETVRVESAAEMAEAAWSRAADIDAAVLAAAVADFRPAEVADSKLTRADGPPEISLEATPNVLAGLVERTGEDVTLVGFAAETGSLDRAHAKAVTYGVDLLIANDITKAGSGFGTDTNQVTVIDATGTAEALPLMTKAEVAEAIWDRVAAIRGIADTD